MSTRYSVRGEDLRNKYLVAYDVCDPKRLRKTFKKMQGYGEALQLSVFLCELSLKEKAIMISQLENIINRAEDCLMIINLGNAERNAEDIIEFLGLKKELVQRQAMIV